MEEKRNEFKKKKTEIELAEKQSKMWNQTERKRYFENKDPGDQENLIAKYVTKNEVTFFFFGSTVQMGPRAPRR
jgi:hypothetical protein